MAILTENTAFQNIGRCLDGTCYCDHNLDQIGDFLQHCIDFIFYDDIKITGLVSQQTIDNTKIIIACLCKDHNLPEIGFATIDENGLDAKFIIENVSKTVSDNIKDYNKVYHNLKADERAHEWVAKMSKEHYELLASTTNSIKKSNLNFFVDNIKISSFSRDSCFFRIVTENPNLLEEIFKFANKTGWNDAMSYYLLSDIRYYTNKIFAEDKDFVFSPSVKRAKREYNKKIISDRIVSENVENIIKKRGSEIFDIELPSIKEYIIQEGKGEPKNILETVNELRMKFEPLRKLIKEKADNHDTDLVKIKFELDAISHELANEINLQKQGKKIVVVENAITKGDLRASCVQSFTEVINKFGKNLADDGYSKILVKNCAKNYRN